MPVKPGTLRAVSPIEQCWRAITTRPDLTAFLSDTVGISWPVPGGAEASLAGFLYRIDREAAPPLIDAFVCFVGGTADCDVTEVRAADGGAELFPGLSRIFVPTALADLLSDAAHTQFYQALEVLLPRYAHREDTGEAGQIYVECLRQFVAPCFDPFYHALNPDFFDWLGVKPREV